MVDYSKVTLWTIQPIERYSKLLTDKVIYTTKVLIDIDTPFMYPYEWMRKQMEIRISKPNNSNLFPIWAWYQYQGKPKPDLRHSGFLPKGAKGVRIEFTKSIKDIVLSDFDLWHYPLNYWYIADSEQDGKKFDDLLGANGLQYGDIENYPARIKQVIENSWHKIFDMDYNSEYASHSFENKSIQATFWNLSIDEVIKVDKFTAR